MADKKISALTAATTPLAGTEVLPIVQSGSTVKVANNDLRPKQIQSNATSGVLQVTGPAASTTRVMTTPNANFTAARTDAAQTFSGTQSFASNGTTVTNNVLAVFSDGTYPNSGYPTQRFDGFGAGNAYSAAIYGTEYGKIVLAPALVYGGSYAAALTAENGTLDVTINAGNLIVSTAGKGITLPSNITWTSGSGSPEGVVTAPVGSLYSRSNGGAGTSFYVKESGSGNTGWVAK